MAMLAEPRRKQKWSVDPRNSTWSKDESKFGQKLMEKMGWSKGKGLGAKEQGSTEHIKVQVKNNNLGLGASRNHQDNWLAHQDDFNELLAELNNCHGTAESEESPADEEKKSFSLEEKSKSSKKRVHYMKFAKGKDLSSRSDTDLACIFGKREKTKKGGPQEEASAESEENEDQGKQSPSGECDPGNTVTSSLSVNEYFAKRMAELKKSQSKHMGKVPQKEEECREEGADESSTKISQKSKKRKRNKGDTIHDTNDPDLDNGDLPCVTEVPQSKKKSKTKKYREPESERVGRKDEEEEDGASHQNDCRTEEEEKPKKRKKKNKKRKNETSNQWEEEENCQMQQLKKKKKKKSE
ncbi:hypothetical protein XELAEV_18028241mg [Xenopus laevis]|uniref:G-patch domain-containing protein n=2 Tax=Xenopus laevis TaxID=8355 RepID=A0A974HKX7_XENLA|nr:hypothetical protein XELAEV_18028241mg [Xenopus laevis]